MQRWQGERGGLARTGRRLGEKIASGEQRRDRRQLDRRGLFVAEGRESREQAIIQTERGKAARSHRRHTGRRRRLLGRLFTGGGTCKCTPGSKFGRTTR